MARSRRHPGDPPGAAPGRLLSAALRAVFGQCVPARDRSADPYSFPAVTSSPSDFSAMLATLRRHRVRCAPGRDTIRGASRTPRVPADLLEERVQRFPGISCPSSCRHSRMASPTIRRASSIVRPSVTSPGRAGTVTTKPRSSPVSRESAPEPSGSRARRLALRCRAEGDHTPRRLECVVGVGAREQRLGFGVGLLVTVEGELALFA